jgi:methylase of polypeptide subunit release factors
VTAVVSSGDGLDHYRRLLAQATPLLRPGAPLLVQLHGEVRDLALPLAA